MNFREYITEAKKPFTFHADSSWVMDNWKELEKFGKVDAVGDDKSDEYSIDAGNNLSKLKSFLKKAGII